MLTLGWACYYLPPGLSCCPLYLFIGSFGIHRSVSRSPDPPCRGHSRTDGRERRRCVFTRLSVPRTERQRWWNCSRDPADGALLCGQTRSRVHRGSAVGQAGVAGRPFDDLERIRLTAVAFLDRPVLSILWIDRQSIWNHRRRVFICSLISC